jgi:hypothetical protein
VYIYNLGYHSHEESEYVQLSHKDKFTQEKFEEIVMTSAAKIIAESEDKDQTFQDIFSEVMADLIENYGFKQIKFDAEFSVFGWPKIMNKDDWKEDREELLDKLADFIKNRIDKQKQ